MIDGRKGFKLEPFDQVYIRRSPGYQEQRNVSVEGETVFPGSYTLSTKNMRLSELVKSAGGLTTEAYGRGARIERKMTAEEKARAQKVLYYAEQQNADDKDSVKISKLDLSDTYNVGVELDKAIANPGSDYDVVLRTGDKLIVPEYNGTVKISGDVMYPNTVAFEAGRGLRHYVNQAGGFGTHAKKSKAFIVFQNGTISKASRHKVEPGCEIIVPSKSKSNVSLRDIVGIGTSIASLATMVATISYLIK